VLRGKCCQPVSQFGIPWEEEVYGIVNFLEYLLKYVDWGTVQLWL